MKKVNVILLMILMLFALVACSGGSPDTGNEDQFSVAMVVVGPIFDGGWNESAYKGLELAQKEMGAVTAYNEHTDPSDYEKVIKNYAKEGYDVVIGHGFEFTDTINRVAAEFPDTVFFLTSSDPTENAGNGKNIGGVQVDGIQQGFLQGVTAAYINETGVVAGVGGLDIPAIKYALDGFEAGVNYYNEDIRVLKALTGDFIDIAKVKEQSLTMIEQQADVVMSIAGDAGKGAYDAARDRGVYSIGSNSAASDFKNYPETLIASGNVDMAVSIVNVLKKVEDGTFDGSDYLNGVAEGGVVLIINEELAQGKFPGLEELMDEVLGKLASGEIDPNDYMGK